MDELKPCPFCGIEDEETTRRKFYTQMLKGLDYVGITYEKSTGKFYLHAESDELDYSEDCEITACPVCGRPLNRRPAPENKALTLEQLKRMNSDMINRPWVWIEADAELFDSKLVGPAYYQVQDGYKRDRAFCCGYPGLSFCLDYADYGKTWLAYAHRKDS